jgi:hypothetical protein
MNIADIDQLLQDMTVQQPVVAPVRTVQEAVEAGNFPPCMCVTVHAVAVLNQTHSGGTERTSPKLGLDRVLLYFIIDDFCGLTQLCLKFRYHL